jgi:hypothetical protein
LVCSSPSLPLTSVVVDENGVLFGVASSGTAVSVKVVYASNPYYPYPVPQLVPVWVASQSLCATTSCVLTAPAVGGSASASLAAVYYGTSDGALVAVGE